MQNSCGKPSGDDGSFSAPFQTSATGPTYFRNRADVRKPPAAGDFASHYGQLSGFPVFFRRILPLVAGKNPISLIFSVEKPRLLRVKMTEFYSLPYKAAKIYGTRTKISCFDRSEIPISTGQHAILLLSAAFLTCRSASDRHWTEQ